MIRGKSEVGEEELKTLLRVAEDTIPPDRMAIMRVIRRFENDSLTGCSRTKISEVVNIPETSLRRILEQLKRLNLVRENIQRDNYGNPQHFSYRLSEVSPDILGGVPKKVRGSQEGKIELGDTQQTPQKLSKLSKNQEIAVDSEIKCFKEEGVHND